jgi:hypothetical protein
MSNQVPASRPMTPDELAANGYPRDFHSLSPEHKQAIIAERAAAQFPPQPWRDQDLPAVQAAVRQSRDRAQYVRQQKGHSLTLHLLLGAFVLWIPAIYYSVSPNHYWHA